MTDAATEIATSETIGWIAVEKATTLTSFSSDTGPVEFLAFDSGTDAGTSIDGWQDSGELVTFPQAFAGGTTPLVLANASTRNGQDGGWLRQGVRTNTQVRLLVDEDRFLDAERAHGIGESASILAFSDTFTTSVPEPSTYALMGLGIVMWCLARARREVEI